MLASRKNELELGQTKLHLSSVDSTNNYAANMLKVGLLKHGTVILADEQTNGRGQRGSVWQSNPGMNLQMSLILFPENLNSIDQRYLNSFISVSLIKFFERYGLNAKIKWPNDILVNNQKIAGILIENQLKNDKIFSSIVGIGININQTQFGSFSATSLKNEIGTFTLLSDILETVIYELNQYYPAFRSLRYAELEKEYFENLWGFKKLKNFKDKNGVFSGTITGVSPEGLLCIDTHDGEKKYDIKEIAFVLEEDN